MSAVNRLKEKHSETRDKANAKAKGSGFLSRALHQDGPARTGGAKWADVEPEVITFLVLRLTQESCQVTFGMSRDGGALSITIWDGSERHVEWFGQQADISMAVWSFCTRLFPDEGPGV